MPILCQPYAPRYRDEKSAVPFSSAEEVWFWFIQAQAASAEGARIHAGAGYVLRPCEPIDVLRILDRLVRQRCLLRDHLSVLRYYGRRMMPPDAKRPHEARAHHFWREAMDYLDEAFTKRGIVRHPGPASFHQQHSFTEAVI